MDTGFYPHLAPQYHAWPPTARGIAMLRVDKFPYPQKQTRGHWEYIYCSETMQVAYWLYSIMNLLLWNSFCHPPQTLVMSYHCKWTHRHTSILTLKYNHPCVSVLLVYVLTCRSRHLWFLKISLFILAWNQVGLTLYQRRKKIYFPRWWNCMGFPYPYLNADK